MTVHDDQLLSHSGQSMISEYVHVHVPCTLQIAETTLQEAIESIVIVGDMLHSPATQ